MRRAPDEQLYNLSIDPRQTRNVVREQPEIAARLRTQLAELVAGKPGAPVR
jgi:hypothetical protein